MKTDVVQTGRGRDLPLLHSLLADRSSFERVLPELASRYRVTLPNLPGYGASAALAARVRTEGMAGALEVAIRRMFPEDYIAAHPAVVEERKRALAAADPDAFARACRALAELDLTPQLASIANPTLVVVGAEDRTTPPAIARKLADGIPGARYAEIPDCGHCPQIQRPRELVALIDGFLA